LPGQHRRSIRPGRRCRRSTGVGDNQGDDIENLYLQFIGLTMEESLSVRPSCRQSRAAGIQS
jgi:hypothetical protein